MSVSELSLSASPELVQAWVTGWTRSRRTAPPVEIPGGFHIHVGEPGHHSRFVLPAADPTALRRAASATTEPDTWLKVFSPEHLVLPWLDESWTLGEPGFLMTTTLVDDPRQPPAGHRIRSTTTGDVTVVSVLADDQADDAEPAARGQVAHCGGHAVVDRVRTRPEHQRRGLGSVVMTHLAAEAARRGARTGVLGATEAGQALYHTLGWTTRAALTSAVHRGTA